MTAPGRQPPADPRRWPLEPLLDATGLTTRMLSERLGVGGSVLAKARHRGLTDVQADHWAIRMDIHPVLVWGWAWIEAAGHTPHLAHLDIVQALRDQIDDGRLQPGDPLPTIKTLSELWGVGRRTAMRAIAELRADGLAAPAGPGRSDVVTTPGRRSAVGGS